MDGLVKVFKCWGNKPKLAQITPSTPSPHLSLSTHMHTHALSLSHTQTHARTHTHIGEKACRLQMESCAKAIIPSHCSRINVSQHRSVLFCFLPESESSSSSGTALTIATPHLLSCAGEDIFSASRLQKRRLVSTKNLFLEKEQQTCSRLVC